MAYDANEQFASQDVAAEARFFPEDIQPKTFAAGSGTIPKKAAVARNSSTSKWVAWTSGGANETGIIRGFAHEAVALAGGGEVLGNVMMSGIIHLDDIPLNGETLANLKTALKDTVRKYDIQVQGMADFY